MGTTQPRIFEYLSAATRWFVSAMYGLLKRSSRVPRYATRSIWLGDKRGIASCARNHNPLNECRSRKAINRAKSCALLALDPSLKHRIAAAVVATRVGEPRRRFGDARASATFGGGTREASTAHESPLAEPAAETACRHCRRQCPTADSDAHDKRAEEIS